MLPTSIVIELVTTDYVGGAAEITLRTSLDGWEENDIEGKYQINHHSWKFELSDTKYLTDFEFKFVLNRRFWSIGNNFRILGQYGECHKYYLNNFGFELPTYNVYRIDYVHVNEEYRALRAEIQRRSQDQQNIVNTSLLSVGALFGILSAIVNSKHPENWSEISDLLLLIGPWIFLNLGILWCNHNKTIHNIGIYIRDILENRCFPLITPNLNFPVIKESSPYKGNFGKDNNSKELDKLKQEHYYIEKLKSVNLGWQKASILGVKDNPNKLLILPKVFPLIYFGIPSFLLISVYLFNSIKNIDINAIDINSFRTFWNTYFSSLQGLGALFRYLFSQYFIFKWVFFVIDLYLAYVFCIYWRESAQRTTALFRNDN